MAINRYYSAIAQDTTLTSAASSSSTSLVVGATTGFPSSFPFVLAIDYGMAAEELVSVTGVAGLTLTVTRAFNGTTAASHSVGAVVRHVIVAQDMTEMQAHLASTTGAHGVTGAVVGTTDVQILTNKTIDYTSNTITNLPSVSLNLTLNAKTGSYTLLASDVNKLVTVTSASASTITVPSGLFTVGQQVHVTSLDDGLVTIDSDGTSVLKFTPGSVLRTKNSAATIICVATNTFLIVGDLSA